MIMPAVSEITLLLIERRGQRMVVYCIHEDPDERAAALATAGWQEIDRHQLVHPWPDVSFQVAYIGETR